MSKILQKSGEKPVHPDVYIERGPRGGEVPNPRTPHMEPGDKPLPPTQKPGRTWEPMNPPRQRGK
jgi:hypothetical protein